MITENGPIRVSATGEELWGHGTRAFPCGCYNTDIPVLEVPWHWHDELEFVCVRRGTFTYAAAGMRFPVHEGDAVFVNSGVPHAEFDYEGTRALEGSLVCDARMLFGRQTSALWLGCFQELLTPNAPRVVHLSAQGEPWEREAAWLVHMAHAAVVEELQFFEETARHNLTMVCLLLHEHVMGAKDTMPPEANEQGFNRLKLMTGYIEQNFTDELTLSRIASVGGVSEREAQRTFKALTGETPMEYLVNWRLYEASQRLRQTDASVGEVAHACGFASQSYFTKRFRERYGHTPSQHRKL